MKIKPILAFYRKNKPIFIFFIIVFFLVSFVIGSFVIDNCNLKVCGKNSYLVPPDKDSQAKQKMILKYAIKQQGVIYNG